MSNPLKSGRDDWIRTSGPLLPKQVRYQAALHPASGLYSFLPEICQQVIPLHAGGFPLVCFFQEGDDVVLARFAGVENGADLLQRV